MWIAPEPSPAERLLWLAGFPLLAAAALGRLVPAHLDWLGHFLAGFGATLLVVWWTARLAGGRPAVLALATLAAVGAGALAEASLFALAGFDPVDFATQSAGALLAGLALLHGRAGHPQADWPDSMSPLARNSHGRLILALGLASLTLGTLFAFA